MNFHTHEFNQTLFGSGFSYSQIQHNKRQSRQQSDCLLYRGDGIRTHGGIAPTQPFQDCTLNLSDTPLFDFFQIYYKIRKQSSLKFKILLSNIA